MQWKELGKTVANFAPLLGDLLPIPGAGVAGKLIAAAFGVAVFYSICVMILLLEPLT